MHTENEPLVGLGARQFPTGKPVPGFQTAPGRKLVSSAQPSPAKDQPSWAEIFTPQRSTRVQESTVQETRPQFSLEPLRTPAKQLGPQEDISTPQRLLNGTQSAAVAQGHISSTFKNSSSTSATPLRQSSVVSRSFSSDQPPLWSAISTPQRVTRQNVAAQNTAVQITSFQPFVDTTEGSYSMKEFLTPLEKDGFRNEHFKLTTLEVCDHYYNSTALAQVNKLSRDKIHQGHGKPGDYTVKTRV